MKCTKCNFENPNGLRFCGDCGAKLQRVCPQCNSPNPPQFKFCGECGHSLEMIEKERTISEPEGERKYVTAIFSDLSGYTAMSEKLDPEEIKEIMSRIFGEIAQVVTKYEGFIEKFIGDAVVAFFGVPQAHEDDPIRAIKVAREIHELVGAMSPEVEKRTGKPITMHTGINTGLIVTGEVDTQKGTHGLSGDTINVASRLSTLAKAGEILVGHDTYRQGEGHFMFESLEPAILKGKTEPVRVHKVISPRERPVSIHRLSGFKADLIGRKAELTQLMEAVENLRNGRGKIFSICGDAGTGKSRLVEEFKRSLDLERIQWLEGHAYAYSQNIPYFPFIDLLSRALRIEEGEAPEKIRNKVESGIERLVGKNVALVPYVGNLYSLSYPEVEDVSPEFWKSRLQEATRTILSALAKKAPTVFFLEDLHWADPSFVELLRNALREIREPAIVLCVYRPTFSLFTSHQLSGMRGIYREIRLEDLSLSEAEDMLESLLKTESIPSDLKQFVQDKAEGNPFYLEELINFLIESDTLVRENGNWKIRRTIAESDISPTIHGLISGRLDRLEKETKRILQEASVIGRAFLYDILKRITEVNDDVDRGLSTLERLDFIRTRSLQPEIEYMFKHPLTQEVVYNGLLRKERQEIHEQIALVMEHLFQDRLREFYETLAFHFKRGRSVHKAIDYLIKSGEKSLKRYSVEEAHQYYKEAFEVISGKPEGLRETEVLLIDLLVKWSLVFYYRGAFKEQLDLLRGHLDLAESLKDKSRLGMFYAWLGFTLGLRFELRDSYEYLLKALNLGKKINNQQVIGYACAWLAWTCMYLGLLEEAVSYGESAQEIARLYPSDHYLYFKSLAAIGTACHYKGDTKRAAEAGNALLDYGQKHSNIRSMVVGHFVMVGVYRVRGDYPSCLDSANKGSQIAADPFYYQFSRAAFGISCAQVGQFQKAEMILREIIEFSEEFGCEVTGTPAVGALGLVLIGKGQLNQGIEKVEEAIRACSQKESRYWHSFFEMALGQVHLRIIENVPSATQRAEEHFKEAITVATEIGAKPILGQACLGLGVLQKTKRNTDKARECICAAIQLFEQCEAHAHLKQAREALVSLGE